MSKIFLIVVVMSLLTGCSKEVNVSVNTAKGFYSTYSSYIEIKDGYMFKDFTKEYKENECVVILKFAKESGDK